MAPPATFADPLCALRKRVEDLENLTASLERSLRAHDLAATRHIEHYEPVHLIGLHAETNRLHLALRSFYRAGKPYFWTVDVDDLRTYILPRHRFEVRLPKPRLDGSRYLEAGEVERSAYSKLSCVATEVGQPLQNAGLTRCAATPSGCILTVDLCPSRRAFEHSFFSALTSRAKQEDKAVPVALCVSGLWLQDNETLVDRLIDRSATGLDITWVNHSFSHAYYADKATEHNFLLYPGTHLRSEIFETERMLLARGLCPSVFFRLPGLVSDDDVLRTLRSLGLIPLGADAWLAKDQRPRDGSIVLVHGNGNEPQGIALAMPLVKGENQLTLCSLEEEAQKHARALRSRQDDPQPS